MRTRTAQWFETTVRYDKTMENGNRKKVSELYVVDALSFGEAEERITREMTCYISSEFEVKKINPAAYGEIFFSDKSNDDKWYKVKVAFVTIDEKTEKEKRSHVYYLVQASSTNVAETNVALVFANSVMDYVIEAITETKILDVFEHIAQATKKETKSNTQSQSKNK